jgi:outer membrane receptor protein involved in Fe transport
MDLNPSYADTTYYMDNLKGSANIPDAGLYYNPFRTGEKKAVNVAWQGGSDLYNYYTSMDVSDEGGVFPTNGQRVYRLRGNFAFQASENLNISLSNGFISNHTDFNYNDGESWGYVGAVLLGNPEYAPIMRDGVVTCPLGYETARATGQSLSEATAQLCNADQTFIGSNNFARLKTMDVQQDTDRYTGTLALRWTPRPWSSSRLSIGYDSYSERFFNMIPNDPLKVRDSAPQRYLRDVNGKTLTLDGTTAFTFDLNADWRSQTTFGAQFYRELMEEAWGRGTNFPPGAETVGNGAIRDAGEAFAEVRTLGLFVQQQFSFADRLFLTPAVRFDDNSAFGSNLGSIVYPRFSASYVVSEEGWFPQIQMVDQLRLRGAYGTSGKQPGPFDAVTLLSVSSVTLPDGSSGTGFQPTRRGNPDLKPETGSEIELGFDASLWDGRFGVEFTYFNQTTKDALVLKPVPPSTGFTAGVWDNVGEVQNDGVEIALDGTILDGSDVNWTGRLTYSHLTSEITKLAAPIAIGGRGLQEHRQGYPFGAYFMYPVTLEGDQVVVADERVFVGQPTPSYTGAFSSTLSLWNGKVRVYGLLEYMGGHKTVNYTETYQCRTVFATCKARYQRDANGNPTDMARLKGDPAANFQTYHFTYKADFAKLRQLSVNFAIPGTWTRYLGAESGDFGIVGSNLLTFTDYPGTDPEINSQGRENASQREFFSAGVPSAVSFRLSLVY